MDLNDLAAELANVSLWLEALEPGKPLGFLDARIRVGNSLIDTTPALLADGIPDWAFKELEGDDKRNAAEVRKRNKIERTGKSPLFATDADGAAVDLARVRTALIAPTDDVDVARAQARAWERYEASAEVRHATLRADAWTAAFSGHCDQGQCRR